MGREGPVPLTPTLFKGQVYKQIVYLLPDFRGFIYTFLSLFILYTLIKYHAPAVKGKGRVSLVLP